MVRVPRCVARPVNVALMIIHGMNAIAEKCPIMRMLVVATMTLRVRRVVLVRRIHVRVAVGSGHLSLHAAGG